MARRGPLVVLFVLAFVLTWVEWVPRAAGMNTGLAGRARTYAPAVAALVAAALTGGRAALKELVRRLTRWRVSLPGPGLRLTRAVLCNNGGRALHIDSLKKQSRADSPTRGPVIPIVIAGPPTRDLATGCSTAPEGGPLRETSWKRSVRWSAANCGHRPATAGTSERREQFGPERR